MQRYIEGKCEEVQDSDKNLNRGYHLVKEVTGGWTPQTDVINDPNGNDLTETDDIKAFCHLPMSVKQIGRVNIIVSICTY